MDGRIQHVRRVAEDGLRLKERELRDGADRRVSERLVDPRMPSKGLKRSARATPPRSPPRSERDDHGPPAAPAIPRTKAAHRSPPAPRPPRAQGSRTVRLRERLAAAAATGRAWHSRGAPARTTGQSRPRRSRRPCGRAGSPQARLRGEREAGERERDYAGEERGRSLQETMAPGGIVQPAGGRQVVSPGRGVECHLVEAAREPLLALREVVGYRNGATSAAAIAPPTREGAVGAGRRRGDAIRRPGPQRPRLGPCRERRARLVRRSALERTRRLPGSPRQRPRRSTSSRSRASSTTGMKLQVERLKVREPAVSVWALNARSEPATAPAALAACQRSSRSQHRPGRRASPCDTSRL